MSAIDYECPVATKPRPGVFVASSTRVGIAAVRNTGRRILGSVSTRNLGTVSAQNIGHPNRGISIHIRTVHNNLGRHGG